MVRDFVSLLRPYRRQYGVGTLWLLFCDLAQLAVPWALGSFTDGLVRGDLAPRAILGWAFAIAGLAVATAALRYLWRTWIFGASRLVERDFRVRLFEKIQTLPAAYYDRHRTGQLLALATNDLGAIQAAAAQGFLLAVDSAFLGTATLIIMAATINPWLTLAALAPFPLLIRGGLRLGQVVHDRFEEVQEAFGRLNNHVQETIAGIRAVKASAIEDQRHRDFERQSEDYRRRYLSMAVYHTVFEPLIEWLGSLGFVVALGFGGYLTLTGRISLGDFIAFNAYLGMLVWPVIAFSWVINLAERGHASLQRVNAVLAEASAPTGPDVTGLAFQGAIRVRDLRFAFDEMALPVLEGISLEVPAGGFVAIVGTTGSGKSTLAQVLLRLYEPPRGTVFFDGRDVLDVPVAVLRKAIAYVPQESFLFSRSVRENIAFAPNSDPARVEEVARLAGLGPDLASLPEGLDTLVGERGVTLSGGQRQRVAIARALLRDSPILLLDDCLSAVDAATERAILRNLLTETQHRTVFLITHRMGPAMLADEVFVMDGGRIVERGAPRDLAARSGWFARVLARQELEASILGGGA